MNFSLKNIILICLTFCFIRASATHYRAGEILYQWMGGLTFQVQVITYTKISGVSIQADRDTVTIIWGDGQSETIPRINGPIDGNGFPGGVLVLTDVKKNIYQGTHTYAGPPPNGFFVIEFYDQNRMDDILNINFSNSVETPFYVEDTLFLFNTNLIVPSSSPVLETPAVQYASLCDTFFTNPDAVDSDGDSLIYELAVCLQQHNTPVPNYLYPDAFCTSNNYYCGLPNNTCTIDRHTGLFTWADPCTQGIFNVGILIHIYRNGLCIGTMLRDMQILVIVENDEPPQLMIPNDTCIRAGDTLIARISAIDVPKNPGRDSITLTAYGEPFQLAVVPASFAINDTVAQKVPPPVAGTFIWNPVCDDLQEQPYEVFFKAEDNFTAYGPDGNLDPFHLQGFETWSIQVIPPPVLGLTATTMHNGIVLTWQNPYKCAGSTDFQGFSIWRKVGCDPFVPGYCETGLAGTGYVEIATVPGSVYTYTDNTVIPGQAYSYRVLAEFYKLPPNGVPTLLYDYQESVPSNEVCINAPIDVPVILNADVMTTDPAGGQIFVRWQKPLAGGTNLDTIADPPPYRFDLTHNKGFSYSQANATVINSVTYSSFSGIPILDSVIDSLIDTKTTPWDYEVFFYANSSGPTIDTIGASAPASSTYLTIQPSDETLNLHWNDSVPWTNDSFTVYRQNKLTLAYDSIGISYTMGYSDTGLQNDTTYCYYVKGYGYYYNTSGIYPAPLLNRSEQDCSEPIDTVPPCPPTLVVTNDCNQYNGQPWNATQFTNYLTWTNNPDSCSLTITHYRIYYNPNDSSNFTLLDSTTSRTDTTFNHVMNENLAGCYAVTGVDMGGLESKLSNIVCVDNCPYYVLPNAFTPNGDGHNDIFTPFMPYRFVPKIEMQIFNRWGELVFETTNPDIDWDGRDLTGKPVSEGTYLYAGYYYEQRLGGLVRKPLSGQKKGGGTIFLMRH